MYLSVLPREVEDPEDLEGLQRHETNIHIQARCDNCPVICCWDDMLDLPSVINKVVDEKLLVMRYTRDGKPPYPYIPVEHTSDGVPVMTVEKNSAESVLFLAQSGDLTFNGEFTQRIEMYLK